MNVRYGARLIELVKGKSSIEIASKDQLVPTLELIKQAVEAGQLDAQLKLSLTSCAKVFASDILMLHGCVPCPWVHANWYLVQ